MGAWSVCSTASSSGKTTKGRGRGAKDMKETSFRLEVTQTTRPPNYRKTAGLILTACRDFYEKPENEKAFREWKEQRSGKNERAV